MKKQFSAGLMLLVTLLLSACTLGDFLASVTPSGGARQVSDIHYGSHERMRLDLYLPETALPDRPPLVVFFYGGSWNSGGRKAYEFVGKAIASRGVATAIAGYRLYPEVRFPKFVEDSAKAVRWAVKNAAKYGADPDRIIVAGHSAGAYNAAMVALNPNYLEALEVDPRKVVGFIGLAGPYDFLPIKNLDVQPVFYHPNYPSGTQPISFVSALAPPTMLGAASDDELVNPQRNTVQLAEKLRAVDVPVTVKLYPRASHMSLIGSLAGPFRWIAPALTDLTDFALATKSR